MAKRTAPRSLNGEEFLVLQCARGTRRVTLTLPNTESFDLGSYWRANDCKVTLNKKDGTETIERGARAYLYQALPGREQFIEQLLSYAYTYEFAFGDCVMETVHPVNKDTPIHIREKACIKKQFAEAEKGMDVSAAGVGIYIDTPEVRVASEEAPVRRKRL